MLYNWTNQASLDDLLGFLFKEYLCSTYALNGQVSIDKIDVLRRDRMRSRESSVRCIAPYNPISTGLLERLLGEQDKWRFIAIASTTRGDTSLASWFVEVTFYLPFSVTN